ncbi:heterokaryon incompatibility protein (HET) domain-containing protein [Sarocladium implicatum]|nr:heterokaryon incompatibility protein (HET) domain-containing protein [Sarocladium implicatum]
MQMDGLKQPRPTIYHALSPGQTRVLELEPGELWDPIVGRLVPQAISDGPTYDAFSYVWGDNRSRCFITVDGSQLGVTHNLHAALRAFRRRPSSLPTDTSGETQLTQRFWADAVCINQDDLEERISQVEQMSQIYAGADRVLAWLGWDNDEGSPITRAIRLIHSFVQEPEKSLHDARVLLQHNHHGHEGESGTGSEADVGRQKDLEGKGEADKEKEDSNPWPLKTSRSYLQQQYEDQLSKWNTIKYFFDVEYFHRTWIVQELGLAREAVLCTAREPQKLGTDSYQDRDCVPLDIVSITWPLLGRFVRFMDYSGASLVANLKLSSWVAHHILMAWETNDDGTPACDFLTAMHWTRILKVTDPRDRVYGLLGHPLAMVDSQLIVKPDYSHTRGVIYTRMATNFIRKTKNLYVVSLVDHEEDPSVDPSRVWDPEIEDRMPSWVPDWHSINRTTPLDYPIAAADAEDHEIRCGDETEGALGTPLPSLFVRGWVIDEVAAVSQRMETADFPVVQDRGREHAKANPFWLDRMWHDVISLTHNGDAHDDASEPSFDALVALETLSLALAFGTREQDEPVSHSGQNQELKEHQRSFAAYVLEYHKLWHCRPRVGAKDGMPEQGCRSLFDSLPAKVQAELQQRAEGATSTGFIECMTWPSMCRIVFRTVSGLVGIGSRITRPGDAVCRVRGSPALMTIRRISRSLEDTSSSQNLDERSAESITCAYIGPCIVPARIAEGVVDGEAFGEKAAAFRII